MKRWDAIGFDLDGTLWDSTQTVVKSWSKVCREDPRVKKIPDAKDIQGIMGLTLEKIAKRFFPYLSLEEGLEILDRCAQDEVGLILEEGGRLFEGLEAVLREVSARYPLFIVSNCHMGYIEAFLTHHRLARLQRLADQRAMEIVGGGHHHKVQPVLPGALGFLLQHGVVVGIDAAGLHPPFLSGLQIFIPVAGGGYLRSGRRSRPRPLRIAAFS